MRRALLALVCWCVASCEGASVAPINAVVGDASWVDLHDHAPTLYEARTRDDERHRVHLAWIERELRSHPVGHLLPEQRERRLQLLDALAEYRRRGVHPTQARPQRAPRFVDSEGRVCAVGYLIEVSAGREMWIPMLGNFFPRPPITHTSMSSLARSAPQPLTRADADRAYRFAVQRHDDQRYGPYYFPHHLRHTIVALEELGFHSDTHRAVAALHDVLEDTPTGAEELRAQFGDQVTRAVVQLTRPEGVDVAVYIRGLDALAFAVKLADRVSNLRTLGKHAGQEDKDRSKRCPKYEREMPLLRQRAAQLGPELMRAVDHVARELEAARRRLAALGPVR